MKLSEGDISEIIFFYIPYKHEAIASMSFVNIIYKTFHIVKSKGFLPVCANH